MKKRYSLPGVSGTSTAVASLGGAFLGILVVLAALPPSSASAPPEQELPLADGEGDADEEGEGDADGAAPAARPEAGILVPRGAPGWRYLDTGEAPGEGWKEAAFDDSSWGTGAAPLGYGEEDVATGISFGGNSGEKHAAAYFRLRFDLSEQDTAAEGVVFGGRIRFDDGVIAFINGSEVYRMNMGADGEPGHDTFSTGKVSSSSRWEGRYERFFIPKGLLKSGENIFAAQVHQSDAGSSDLVLDLELVVLSGDGARREARPDLFQAPSGELIDPVAGDEIYLDDLEVVRNIALQGKRLLAEGRATAGRSLLREMENNRQFPILNLPIGGLDELTPAQVYRTCAPSVLIISPVSEASDPNNPGEGWGSGFVITADGIAVTNWHVIEAMKDADLITATTFEGRVFPLQRVLAARKDEDIAVIQLETGGQKLPPLTLTSGEAVGEPVTVISHPRTNFFNLTHGHISRYFKSRANGARHISVTAGIAGGSSGAPILNRRGEVIGVVSMTESLSASPVILRGGTLSPQEEGNDADAGAGAETPEGTGQPDNEGSTAEETPQAEDPRNNDRRPVQLVPSAHQLTMKYGTPAVSVLELLE